MNTVDTHAVETKVKDMYERVAQDPHGEFHFEMGRALAERLGYSPYDLDRVPASSIDSFAGVGHHFELAALQSGERVLDLGSGSGLDSFVASLKVGPTGQVVGIDMTVGQLEKATELRRRGGFSNIEYVQGYIDQLPFEDESFDAVISNGVINLVANIVDWARPSPAVGDSGQGVLSPAESLATPLDTRTAGAEPRPPISAAAAALAALLLLSAEWFLQLWWRET